MIVAESPMKIRRFKHIQPATTLRKILWSIRAVPMGMRFDSGSAAHIALFAIMALALGMGEVQPDNRTLAGVALTLAFVLFIGVQVLHSYLAWTSLVHRIQHRTAIALSRICERSGALKTTLQAIESDMINFGGRCKSIDLESLSHDERIAYQEGQAEGRAHYHAMRDTK